MSAIIDEVEQDIAILAASGKRREGVISSRRELIVI
jgi:hypothetical protein